jgi:hypothetical protein
MLYMPNKEGNIMTYGILACISILYIPLYSAQQPAQSLQKPTLVDSILESTQLEQQLEAIVRESRLEQLIQNHRVYLQVRYQPIYHEYQRLHAAYQTYHQYPTAAHDTITDVAHQIDNLQSTVKNLVDTHHKNPSYHKLIQAAQHCQRTINSQRLLSKAIDLEHTWPGVLNFGQLRQRIQNWLDICMNIITGKYFPVDIDTHSGPLPNGPWRSPLTVLLYQIQDLDRQASDQQHRE